MKTRWGVNNVTKRIVTLNEKEIKTTTLEFDLLCLFITNLDKSFSREEILNKVWGDTSANAEVQSWMNSQTHKDNLLISYYTKSAVACYQNGKYCYYVQLFAY